MNGPETVRVKPAHPSQGAWVVINKDDYDPARHVLYEAAPAAVPAPKPQRRKRNES